jgi:16S rRNA (cytosine1402-N4)-methyltransferase
MTGAPGHQASHISVLKDEVVFALSPKDNEIFVDGTFGAGGYTRAILEEADCKVFAIDRDPQAIKIGQAMEKEFPGRLKVLEGQYSNMVNLLAGEDVAQVDGIALDIGVSSMQIDEGARGFSFQKDGPLDMRMSGKGETAADVVNTYPEEELANIFYQLGDEKKSRPIARAIAERREVTLFKTTLELAELIGEVIWVKRKKGKKFIQQHGFFKPFAFMSIMNWGS